MFVLLLFFGFVFSDQIFFSCGWGNDGAIYQASDSLEPVNATVLIDSTIFPSVNVGVRSLAVIPKIGLFFSLNTGTSVFFYDFQTRNIIPIVTDLSRQVTHVQRHQNSAGKWSVYFSQQNFAFAEIYLSVIDFQGGKPVVSQLGGWNVTQVFVSEIYPMVILVTKDERTIVIGVNTDPGKEYGIKFMKIDMETGGLVEVDHQNLTGSLNAAFLTPDEKTVFFSTADKYTIWTADFPEFATVEKLGNHFGFTMATNGESLLHDNGMIGDLRCAITRRSYYGDSCVVEPTGLPTMTRIVSMDILRDD